MSWWTQNQGSNPVSQIIAWIQKLCHSFSRAHVRSSVAAFLFATRENTRCSQFVSPCIDNSPNCVGWDVTVVDWSRFQQIYLFPPVSLLIKLIPKIRKYTGRGLLIAPLQNGPVLTLLRSKAFISQQLPDSYFLFQMVNGEMVERKKFHDYWMWVF